MYTASSLIAIADSVADLQETQTISYDDKVSLLNEAWRNLYSRYTESDGDYWVTEVVIDLTPAMVDPNSSGQVYNVPLPADFYKLRMLDYGVGGGYWRPVDRFATAQRDNNPGTPRYRMKNGKIWLICPQGLVAQLKVAYYTAPPIVTLPRPTLECLPDAPTYTLPNYKLGYYQENDNVLFYILNGNQIRIENQKSGGDVLLYTSANPIRHLRYYGGYLYWLDTVANIIYRAPTDYSTTLVPVNLGLTAVTDFSVLNGFVYYSTATNTYRTNLDGSGSILQMASPSIGYQPSSGFPLYINPANGYVNYAGIESTTIQGSYIVQYDNQATLWSLDNKLIQLNLDTVTHIATLGETLASDILAIGQVDPLGYLPVRTDSAIQAFSLIADYQFDYPANEVNEILAYHCAYGFLRKITDVTKMAIVEKTQNDLWERFWSVNKQDEHEFTRINNAYESDFRWI